MVRETWSDAERRRLKELWGTMGTRAIARAMGKTPGQIAGKSRIMHLHFSEGKPLVLGPDHPAIAAATTLFPQKITTPDDVSVLKSGDNQRKLGGRVTKGPWRGMPIFSLTLVERATCPGSCLQWNNCTGNHMPLARRYSASTALERRLAKELAGLQIDHPKGFVVRLHMLGDFYSLRYVALWEEWLAKFPALHVFGYSARLPGDPIGRAVAALRDKSWDRFAVRTSGGCEGPRTMVSANPYPGAITCPAQTGGTSHCGSCGLCWAPAARHRTINFLPH